MLSANRLRPNVKTAPVSTTANKISQLPITVLQVNGKTGFLKIKSPNLSQVI